MKQQGFKEAIQIRLRIFIASTIFSFQKETAYFANNWASLLSTTFYTLTMLLFINVLYGNVKTIAGYTKNEMLFFFLVGQVAYYITANVSFDVMRDLIDSVNRGDLDLILTKPIPSLFYLTFRQVKLVSTLRDGVPPTIAIILAIDWGALHLPLVSLLSGIPVFLAGIVCMHVFQFLAVVPVFWLGESNRILKMAFAIYAGGGATIPLEGFVPSLRILLSSVFPVLIVTAFTASIVLGKSSPLPLFIWSVSISLVAFILMQNVWNIALKHYTSASS